MPKYTKENLKKLLPDEENSIINKIYYFNDEKNINKLIKLIDEKYEKKYKNNIKDLNIKLIKTLIKIKV